jgi:hypothetical protein
MTDNTCNPPMPTLTEAILFDPHENARRAEKSLDAPRRHEQEEAMRIKEQTSSSDHDHTLRDITTDRPAD